MTKIAFVLGFSYPEDAMQQIRGASMSALDMKNFLIKSYGFKIDDIYMCLDSCPLPSMGNHSESVLRHMTDVAQASQAGDTLVVFMAGHGGKKLESIKQDGKRYFMETGYFRAASSSLISEFGLTDVFTKVPKGVSLTFVADFCYSGGIFEGLIKQFEDPIPVVTRGIGALRDYKHPPSKLPPFIFMYAAPKSQESLVIRTVGRQFTLFTRTLIDIVQETTDHITNYNLIDRIRKRLKSSLTDTNTITMSPGLCCSNEQRDLLFLGDSIQKGSGGRPQNSIFTRLEYHNRNMAYDDGSSLFDCSSRGVVFKLEGGF